jgi:hypothetical protein
MDTPEIRLQALLARQNDHLPTDDYFRTVLPKFHRHLRVQAIERPTLSQIILSRCQELFQEVRFPAPRLAGGLSLAFATVTVGLWLSLGHLWKPAELPLLTLQENLRQKAVTASAALSDDAWAQQLQELDFAAPQRHFLAAAEQPTRYVLVHQPASYETEAAF